MTQTKTRTKRSMVSYLVPGWSLAGLIFSSLFALPGHAADNGQPVHAGDTVKIGFITSLTGNAASSGKDMLNGFNLYLEQHHHELGGKKVELLTEDDESDKAQAVVKVNKLIKSDPIVVVGIVLSNIASPVCSVTEKANMPILLPCTGLDELTQRKRSNLIIRTGFTASQSMHPFGEWAFKHLGYKRIVTCAMDYPFGWESVGGFQEGFEEAGGKIVQKVWTGLKSADFSIPISEIHKNADAILDSNVAKGSVEFMKEYARKGPKLPILAAGPAFDESVLKSMGDEALGVLSASPYSAALDNPDNKKFVKAYRDKYGSDPSFFAESSYTTAMWLNHGIEAAGNDVFDKLKLVSALRKVSIQHAPRGPIKLDDYGNPIENIYVRKVEKVDGKLQNTVIHTFPAVSQFGHWKPADYLSRPAYKADYPACKYCEK